MKPAQRVRIETDEDMVRSVKGVIADGEPRLLERDGVVVAQVLPPDADIRLASGPDIWEGYDPDKIRKAVSEVGPVFLDLDVERFKRDLREQRIQDSKGRPG